MVMTFSEELNICMPIFLNIVTRIAIASQRLGKQTSMQATALNNKTSIGRLLRGKHASSTIYDVFSVWSVARGYESTQSEGSRSREWLLEWSEESSFETSACQVMGTGIRFESSLRIWRLQNNDKNWIALYVWFEVTVTLINPLSEYA
jgi:hypothetical protein